MKTVNPQRLITWWLTEITLSQALLNTSPCRNKAPAVQTDGDLNSNGKVNKISKVTTEQVNNGEEIQEVVNLMSLLVDTFLQPFLLHYLPCYIQR